jgi:hypothetical protein
MPARRRCAYSNPEAPASAESGPIKKRKRVVAIARI